MSDITATNCGCDRDCGCERDRDCGFCNGIFGSNGNCSCLIWILIILALCGNNGSDRCGCGFGGDNCCWILLILLFCGNNGFC